MHILLGILGFIGGLGMLLWRIKMAVDAAKNIASTANDAKNYMRKRRWQKKAAADPIKDINDPRESAAAILAALASYDGAMSDAEEAVILREIKSAFQTSDDVATELLAHGRWLSKDSGDLNAFISRLLPPIVRHCSQTEKQDLLAMMERVILANGSASDLEKDAILFAKRHLAL